MSKTSNATEFAAYANGDLALLRVVGPGVCRESGRFEVLLAELARRDFRKLVFDFTECPRMDSTFAGALLRLAEVERSKPAGERRLIAVIGASEQVNELLDTLWLGDVLLNVNVTVPPVEALAPLPLAEGNLTREQILALSVDGHERLAQLNEENAKRFGSMLELLRSELGRLQRGEAPGVPAVCPPVTPAPASPPPAPTSAAPTPTPTTV